LAFDFPKRAWHDAQTDVTAAAESLRALASGMSFASLACSSGASPWQLKQSIYGSAKAGVWGLTAVGWQPGQGAANVLSSQWGLPFDSRRGRRPRPKWATTDSSSAFPYSAERFKNRWARVSPMIHWTLSASARVAGSARSAASAGSSASGVRTV